MTTTITLELNDQQRTALLALLHARPSISGSVEQQLSYKVQNAIRDAERARALLRGEKTIDKHLYTIESVSNGT